MQEIDLLNSAVLHVSVGSRSRDLHHEKSDYDYRGVFALPPKSDWSFDYTVPESVNVNRQDGETIYDEQWFELRRFLQLMTKSSDFLEFLFVSRKDVLSANRFGKMLRHAAHKFTNKNHVKRLIAAGGNATTDDVEEYIRKKDSLLLGHKNLLYKAAKLMEQGLEVEARKELCDVLRRLYVAQFMLSNTVRSYEVWPESEKALFPISHELTNDWEVALKLYKETTSFKTPKWFEDGDALFYVKHPNQEVTDFLRKVRYGDVTWDGALRVRNILYHDVVQALENSTLRETSETFWLNVFLNYYFEMQKI